MRHYQVSSLICIALWIVNCHDMSFDKKKWFIQNYENLSDFFKHPLHEGVKNNKCELCDKSFSRAGDLKRHINCVHEGLKNHKCDLCDKAFSQPWTLKKHVNSVHEGLKNLN